MKKIPVYDIVFILISAIAFSTLNYLGFNKVIWSFGIILTLIAYYIGKKVGKAESKSKVPKD